MPVPYQRASKYGDVLEDTFNIKEWEKRHVALGVVDRPDIGLQIAAHRDDKRMLNRLADQAKEAAGVSKSSNTGTALHKVTERIDLGEEVPTLPDPYQADIEAFQAATEMLEPIDVERFLVNDHVKVAGTADRLYRIGGRPALTVGDTKTGKTLDYGMGKIAIQLALYSRSKGYDPETGERIDLNIDQDWGLVVHLPAGTGTCELVWVNLQLGWAGVLLAQDVRDYRKLGKKQLTESVDFEDLIA